MSIQLLARDLYKLIKEVDCLEKELEKASFDKKEAIKDVLRKKRAERNLVRGLLDGRKD